MTMKATICAFLSAFGMFLFIAPAQTQTQGKPCPGLTGAARTECLRREVNRGNAENARNAAYLASLNQSMTRACRLADAADSAASALAEGKVRQVSWAGKVWISARALGMAAARSHDE